MTREEAIAAGMEVHEIQHSMKRRTPWHDYSRKGTYMLTLVVRERAALFGTLKGDLEGGVAPYVEYSNLGMAILQGEIHKIHHFYPQVEVWKLCIMPDHLHMIVRVNEDMGEGKHLGKVVRGFKTGCTRAWWRLQDLGEMPKERWHGETSKERWQAETTKERWHGETSKERWQAETTKERWQGETNKEWWQGENTKERWQEATVPSASPEGLRSVLFGEGYCDKILMHEGQLDNWKHYLDDNPRRLMMKRLYPELFTVLTGMEVVGEQCQVIGNRFLLDIPDKMAVIVHRRYTDEENARLKEEWLACGERGGVLVSAAISPKEKEVLREAMNRGCNIILLKENGFPKLYKPAGEAFDACAAGLLLQISPWEFHMEKKVITRAQCLHLNAMAEMIAGNK